MMTRELAMQIACTIMALVKHSKADFSTPCDGFCSKCPAARNDEWSYRNTGKELKFIERAVRERLVRKGIEPNFNVLAELRDLWHEAGVKE